MRKCTILNADKFTEMYLGDWWYFHYKYTLANCQEFNERKGKEILKITIEADAKEIAALVLALQERREFPTEIQCEFDGKQIIESALATIRDMREAYSNGDSKREKPSDS